MPFEETNYQDFFFFLYLLASHKANLVYFYIKKIRIFPFECPEVHLSNLLWVIWSSRWHLISKNVGRPFDSSSVLNVLDPNMKPNVNCKLGQFYFQFQIWSLFWISSITYLFDQSRYSIFKIGSRFDISWYNFYDIQLAISTMLASFLDQSRSWTSKITSRFDQSKYMLIKIENRLHRYWNSIYD